MSLNRSYAIGASTVAWAYFRAYSRVTSGKHYTEVLVNRPTSNDPAIGVVADGHEFEPETFLGDLAADYGLFCGAGVLRNNGGTIASPGAVADGTTVAIRVDMDAATPTVEFKIGAGAWLGPYNLTVGAGVHLAGQTPALSPSDTFQIVPEADFSFAIPSGFTAWPRVAPTAWDHLCNEERTQHTIVGDTITPDVSTDSRAYGFVMPFRTGGYQFRVSGRTSSISSQQPVRFGFVSDYTGDLIDNKAGQLGGTGYDELVVSPDNHDILVGGNTRETMGGTPVGTDAAFTDYLAEIDTTLGQARFSPDNGTTWSDWWGIGFVGASPFVVGYRFVALVGDAGSGTPQLTVNSWPTLQEAELRTDLGFFRGFDSGNKPSYTLDGDQADFSSWEFTFCPIPLAATGTTYWEIDIIGGSQAGIRWLVGIGVREQIRIDDATQDVLHFDVAETLQARVLGVGSGVGDTLNNGGRVGIEYDGDNNQARYRIDGGTFSAWIALDASAAGAELYVAVTATTFDIRLRHQRADMVDAIPSGAQMIDRS